RTLFPHFLGKKPIFGAFWGFAQSEKKTLLSPHSGRTLKSGGHYLRVLFNGIELLRTGNMTVKIAATPIGSTVAAAKRGEISVEEVLRIGEQLEREFEEAERHSSLHDLPTFPRLTTSCSGSGKPTGDPFDDSIPQEGSDFGGEDEHRL